MPAPRSLFQRRLLCAPNSVIDLVMAAAQKRASAGWGTPAPLRLERSLAVSPTADIPLRAHSGHGDILHRVHRTQHELVFFGPGAVVPLTYRFDSGFGRSGVLCVGASLNGALAETILRNPQRLMVAMSEITTRSASTLTCDRDLGVVAMRGPGLQALGADNAISIGPYDPCGAWADALWDHPERPDGIVYLARHDPNEV